MKFNVCTVKPKNYPHSDAFWELAELLTYSLRDLNQDVILTVNEVVKDRQNILFGAHLLTDFDLPSSTIIFNTEQLWNGVDHWVNRILKLGEKYTILDYDDNNLEFLKKNGCKNLHKFQIGFHEQLYRIPVRKHKDIDVLFYGSLNEKRKNLLAKLANSGLNVKHLFGVYGSLRDEYISGAKIILNCHLYEAKIFEVVRVHYLVNNKIPVVSELDIETKIEPFWKKIILGVPYEDIIYECSKLSKDKQERFNMAENAFMNFQKRHQAQYTKKLLKNIL